MVIYYVNLHMVEDKDEIKRVLSALQKTSQKEEEERKKRREKERRETWSFPFMILSLCVCVSLSGSVSCQRSWVDFSPLDLDNWPIVKATTVVITQFSKILLHL